MKTQYPLYNHFIWKDKKRIGELQIVKNNLSRKNKEIIKEFLEQCRITASEGKVVKIERVLLQFCDIVEKDLDKITKEDVDSFLVLLNKREGTFWTKNEIKIYLKKFLLWKYEDLKLVKNIKTETQTLNEEKVNENNLLTSEEFEKLLRGADRDRDRAFLSIIWQTGCRPQEIVNLKWEDINLNGQYAEVSFYSGKTKKARTFPLENKKFIMEWKNSFCYNDRKNNDYVFPSPYNRSKPMNIISFNSLLKRIAKRVGIEKNIWNYLFRYSRLTPLYEELPQQIVEKLAGHKDMAGIYAKISNKKARDELIKKVYKHEELTPTERDKMQKQIESLEEQIFPLFQRIADLEEKYGLVGKKGSTMKRL